MKFIDTRGRLPGKYFSTFTEFDVFFELSLSKFCFVVFLRPSGVTIRLAITNNSYFTAHSVEWDFFDAFSPDSVLARLYPEKDASLSRVTPVEATYLLLARCALSSTASLLWLQHR